MKLRLGNTVPRTGYEALLRNPLDGHLKKIAQLEEKLQKKNEVVSELLEEHVQLKEELGEP